MYYVEVKAAGGPEGDEHYRSSVAKRREAMDIFWDTVREINRPLVDTEEFATEDGDFDTIVTATGSHPDFTEPVFISMYWED